MTGCNIRIWFPPVGEAELDTVVYTGDKIDAEQAPTLELANVNGKGGGILDHLNLLIERRDPSTLLRELRDHPETGSNIEHQDLWKTLAFTPPQSHAKGGAGLYQSLSKYVGSRW